MNMNWFKNGCINDMYFNWMLSLWTAQDDNVKFINENNTAYRKFVSFGKEGIIDNKDNVSHYRRIQLISEKDWVWRAVDSHYYNNLHSIWKDKTQWVESPQSEHTNWSRVDRNKLFWNIYGSGPKFTSIYQNDGYEIKKD